MTGELSTLNPESVRGRPSAGSQPLTAAEPPEMASELDAPQLEFFLGDDKPGKIDYSKPAFSYTAERLWRDRPDVAKAAIKLLAEPREVTPYRRIMSRLHVSYHLLRQLELTQGSAIAKEKKSLGDLMYTATEAYMEKAIELAPSMKSGKDAMIAAGIASDKFLQFRGEATQKIELTANVNFHVELQRLATEALEKLANVTEISRPPELMEENL